MGADVGTHIPRRKGLLERILTRALTMLTFLLIGFCILRFAIGAGRTLALSLAYIDAVVSIAVVDIKERLDAR